jgi:hypothetical protein
MVFDTEAELAATPDPSDTQRALTAAMVAAIRSGYVVRHEGGYEATTTGCRGGQHGPLARLLDEMLDDDDPDALARRYAVPRLH